MSAPVPPKNPASNPSPGKEASSDWLHIGSSNIRKRLAQPDTEAVKTLGPEDAGAFSSLGASALDPVTLSGGDPFGERPVPQRLGPYDIQRLLAHGGMGAVYLAFDPRLKRQVAVKVVLAGEHASTENLNRFRAEAETVARLHHPHIVQIYEVGQEQGLPFLALEYLDGGNLHDRLRGRPLPPRDAATLLLPLAEAVQYAHERGIIHRDLKPSNILLEQSDQPSAVSQTVFPSSGLTGEITKLAVQPKITDFGLAKLTEGSTVHTRTGDVLGTPNYMAPEQARGRSEEIGPAVDIYALGAILYETLTGRPPFQGTTPLDVLMLVQTTEPVSPLSLQPLLPNDLDTICLKCLQKEPHKRYPSASALADDLRRYLDGQPILARPVGPVERVGKWAKRRPAVAALSVAMALLLVVGIVVVSWLWKRAEDRANAEALAKQDAEAARKTADEQKAAALFARNVALQQRKKAEEAQKQAETAQAGEKEARDEAESALYFSRIALALREYEARRMNAAEKLLGDCIPKPGRPDLRHWEWHYLHRLCRGDLWIQRSYGGWGWSIAYSPDGKYLATASGIPTFPGRPMQTTPGELILWNAVTGAFVARLEGHTGTVGGVRFSPDSKLLSSVGADGQAIFWDLPTGQRRPGEVPSHWEKVADHHSLFAAPQFAPDGHTALLWGENATSLEIDLTTGKNRPLPGRIMGQSRDGLRRLWWLGGEQWRLEDSGKNHDWTLAGTDPRKIHALCPQGRWFCDVNLSEVRLVDAVTGKVIRTLTHPTIVWSVAFSPDGLLLATAGDDSSVRVWSLPDGALLREYRGHQAPARSVTFSPDGASLASIDQLSFIKTWDLTRTNPQPTLNYPSVAFVRAFGISPDGRHATYEATHALIRYCDLMTGRVRAAPDATAHDVRITYPCSDVVFSPDGRLMAAAAKEDHRIIKVWDTQTRREVSTLQGHKFPLSCLAFSGDGKRLVTAGTESRENDGQIGIQADVFVWDVATGHAVCTTGELAQSAVSAVALDEEGRLFAYALSGNINGRMFRGPIVVFDTNGVHRHVLAAPNQTTVASSLAISRDGSRLAATDMGTNLLRLWDLGTGKQVTAQPLVTGATPTSVAFSPDGKRVVATGFDSVVKLWDARTGHEICTLADTPGRQPGDIAFSARVMFSRDGTRLAALNHHGQVMLWDGTPLAQDFTPRDREELTQRRFAWWEQRCRHAIDRGDDYAIAFNKECYHAAQKDPLELCVFDAEMATAEGRWDEARKVLAAGVAKGLPLEGKWFPQLAVLYLHQGDLEGYHALCRRLRQLPTKPCLDYELLNTFLFGPGGHDHPAELQPLVAEELKESLARPNQGFEYALWCLRAGMDAEAEDWINRELNRGKFGYDVRSLLLLALFQEKQGNRDAARKTLADAEAQLQKHLPGHPKDRNGSPKDWNCFEWLHQEWLLREVRQKLQGR